MSQAHHHGTKKPEAARHAHGEGHTEFVAVKMAVLTVSDTRTPDTDSSGNLICEKLRQAGHTITRRKICRDDIGSIREIIHAWSQDSDVDFAIVTGGTGVTGRDVTPDAVAPMFTKHLPGFGEMFRSLSAVEIGTSAIQSRADAGLVGHMLVFLIPGSAGAVTLAMDKIILDQIDIRHAPCNFTEMLPRIREGNPPAKRMNAAGYLTLAAAVFSIISAVHLIRLFTGWNVMLIEWDVPVWLSIFPAVGGAGMAAWAIRLRAGLR